MLERLHISQPQIGSTISTHSRSAPPLLGQVTTFYMACLPTLTFPSGGCHLLHQQHRISAVSWMAWGFVHTSNSGTTLLSLSPSLSLSLPFVMLVELFSVGFTLTSSLPLLPSTIDRLRSPLVQYSAGLPADGSNPVASKLDPSNQRGLQWVGGSGVTCIHVMESRRRTQ